MKKKITALLLALVMCVALLTPAIAAEDYAERAAEISYYISKYSLDYKDSHSIPLLDALEEVLRDNPELFEQLVNAMFARLDDYSEYMSEKEYEASFSRAHTYVGVGITLDPDYPFGVVVESVVPGSPAEKKGIQPGDIVTSIDGVNVELLRYNEIGEFAGGDAGTIMKMGILRQDAGRIELEIERRVIIQKNVTYEYAGNGVGVISLGSFGSLDYRDFSEAYYAFSSDERINSVIIDVRGNTGGDVNTLYNILDIMIAEKGALLFALVDSQEKEEYKSSGSAIWTPDNTIILVNGRSVSAAEVFAGSLQKLGLAEIVGTSTYGKARSQYHITLFDDSVAIISSYEALLPDGSSYEGEGITPDFVVYNDGEPYPLDKLNKLNTSTPLYKGRTSDAILAMQQRLYALGIFPVEPNGYFGDITLWSLNVFQKTMDLKVTSHATPETLKALDKEAKEAKIYKDFQMEFAMNRLKGAAVD